MCAPTVKLTASFVCSGAIADNGFGHARAVDGKEADPTAARGGGPH